jgi:hypothetical protein
MLRILCTPVHCADDRIEPCASDAADNGASEKRAAKAAPYQRTKFATRYTAGDVGLLAYVDKTHGNLSGPATRRIPPSPPRSGSSFNEKMLL